MDPLGAETGLYDPYSITNNPVYEDVHGNEPLYRDGGDPFNLGRGCGTIDGMPASCSEIRSRMATGSLEVAAPTFAWSQRHKGWELVRFNSATGRYRIFSHFDQTSTTFEGRTSGRWHPVFDTITTRLNIGGLFFGMGFGGRAQRAAPQQPTPEQSAATRAAELLQQQRCADFVRSVYDNAIAIAGGTITNTGITPTNDMVRDLNGRPIARPQTSATVSLDAYNVALADGRVSASGATIGTAVGQTRNNSTITWNNSFYDLGVDDRARHTIHEGFHQIPNINDFVLLEAGARATSITTPRATTGREASRLFNDILFPRCGGR